MFVDHQGVWRLFDRLSGKGESCPMHYRVCDAGVVAGVQIIARDRPIPSDPADKAALMDDRLSWCGAFFKPSVGIMLGLGLL